MINEGVSKHFSELYLKPIWKTINKQQSLIYKGLDSQSRLLYGTPCIQGVGSEGRRG